VGFPDPLSGTLNPIEQLFAKLKAMLRKAAARSLKSLWKVVGLCIKLVPGKECAAYLANSGYRQPCRKML
jgi:transposase